MGKLIERCAGIDIGKRFLVCCVMTGAAHEEPCSETRRFDTTVPGLKRLRNWLHEERVTDVVMESTGSDWIPVFNLLEGHVTVVLANPEEVKNRKGHKTDRKDAGHLVASRLVYDLGLPRRYCKQAGLLKNSFPRNRYLEFV